MEVHTRLQVQGSGTEDKRANARTGAIAEMNGWGMGGQQGAVAGLFPRVNCSLCPTAFYGLGKCL